MEKLPISTLTNNFNVIDTRILLIEIFIQVFIQQVLIIMIMIILQMCDLFRSVNISSTLQDLSILSKQISNNIEYLKINYDENLKKEILNRIFIFDKQFENILNLLQKHKIYKKPINKQYKNIIKMNKIYNENSSIEELEGFDKKFLYLVNILSEYDKIRIQREWEKQMYKYYRKRKL